MAILPPHGGGITLVVFVSVFLPLTIIATTSRLWARRIKKKRLEVNDYAIIIASILAVANAILTLLAVIKGGVGQHVQNVLPEVQTLEKITLALALVWTLANTAVKISILHLYIAIFYTRKFLYAAYFVMFLTAGYALTNCAMLLADCQPVSYNWDKSIKGHCSKQSAPFLASACINMSIDVIIVVLPMPMLWTLHMPTSRKVGLTVIFGVGTLICVLSAVRISAIATLDYNDFSYSVVQDGVYSVLEPCLGVINASLPVLQPVMQKLSTSKMFSLVQKSGRSKSSNQRLKGSGNSKIGRGEDMHSKRFHRLNFEPSLEDHIPLAEGHNLSKVMDEANVEERV